MNNTFELGNTNKLIIILSEETLEFKSDSDVSKNGVYPYKAIREVELNKGKTLWIISFITWLVDLFSGIHIGGKYRQKRNIEILVGNERLKIGLSKSELEVAEKVVSIIQDKISR